MLIGDQSAFSHRQSAFFLGADRRRISSQPQGRQPMHQGRGRLGRGAAALTILVACGLIALPAQSRRFDADELRTAYDSYRSMQRSSPYASLRWQSLGPNNIRGPPTSTWGAD